MREQGSDTRQDGEQPPFFIIGNDRSGTTMLRLILDRSPELSIPTESMYVADFAPLRSGGADLSDHAASTAFTRKVWNHPKVKLWGLPGAPPLPPAGLTHLEAYRFGLEAPYRAYAARDDKPRWGDKTPYYLEWIDELKAVWPEARFIEIVRDGRDVAMSIMPLPFGGNNVWVAASDWARGIRLGREAAERYPGDVYTVRYEQLTAAPEQHVRGVCDFLGIEFLPDMLNIERTDPGRIVADQADWFTNLWSGINQKSVGKWRKRMSPRDQAVFAAAARDELEMCGYELGDHADDASISAVRAAGFEVSNLARRMVNVVKLRIVQERGRELTYVARRKLRRIA